MPRKISPEEYKNIFSINYPDYELLSDYSGDKNYIMVRCKIDGNVWQTKPNWLKHGVGCQECYNRRRGNTRRLGKEQFIEKARKVHGNKYEYDNVVYSNSKTPVSITCLEHGDFKMTPNKHLNGQGCPICARIKNGINKRLSNKTFIEKCTKIHNGKYDYSKVEYCGYDKPVTIICPKHGEFKQIAGIHLAGCGCPVCNESHLEKETIAYLNSNNIAFEYQKRFEWLGRQSLDFYLPKYNIGIECQGLQHYTDYYFSWKGKASLKDIVKRDENKNFLCENNNVHLYYLTKSMKILEISNIYTKNNTFSKLSDLLNNITKETLFENIANELLNKK